jgi:pyruvate formate lyase activating enzyme
MALESGSEIIVSTYNEPLITAEWAVAIFKEAKAAGLMTGFVSNGNATPEVLEYLQPWIDLFKVDLKTFDDKRYRRLGGRLEPVRETIRRIHEMGIWLEIVTLLVPGFNDSQQELKSLTEFIARISPEIPWHVTAFHKDYKMTEPENTKSADLLRATEIARETGLRYIYAGNLPGRLANLENTYCPDCRKLLVERRGFQVLHYSLTADGRCPDCSHAIPGRWSGDFSPSKNWYS